MVAPIVIKPPQPDTPVPEANDPESVQLEDETQRKEAAWLILWEIPRVYKILERCLDENATRLTPKTRHHTHHNIPDPDSVTHIVPMTQSDSLRGQITIDGYEIVHADLRFRFNGITAKDLSPAPPSPTQTLALGPQLGARLKPRSTPGSGHHSPGIGNPFDDLPSPQLRTSATPSTGSTTRASTASNSTAASVSTPAPAPPQPPPTIHSAQEFFRTSIQETLPWILPRLQNARNYAHSALQCVREAGDASKILAQAIRRSSGLIKDTPGSLASVSSPQPPPGFHERKLSNPEPTMDVAEDCDAAAQALTNEDLRHCRARVMADLEMVSDRIMKLRERLVLPISYSIDELVDRNLAMSPPLPPEILVDFRVDHTNLVVSFMLLQAVGSGVSQAKLQQGMLKATNEIGHYGYRRGQCVKVIDCLEVEHGFGMLGTILDNFTQALELCQQTQRKIETVFRT
eukprot:Clim_evm12s183 gene=Clim_evmTU12s183